MFRLIKETAKGMARRGELTTSHGTISTPVFMPVGTAGSVKAMDTPTLLNKIRSTLILANTYHLYLRPGRQIIQQAGGLHAFMNWPASLLTDSGGYQVFSLSHIRKIESEGVIFKSHLDGSSHLFTPENVVETQRILGSDIMMALDECPAYPADRNYIEQSLDLTHEWARKSLHSFHCSSPHYDHPQFLFGIIQGGMYPDLRVRSAQTLCEMNFDGMAIGGLSVGEPAEMMFEMTEICTPLMPRDKPRYLMGVGTPSDILESVARGIDLFDCVMPTRNARNGMLFTRNGTINIRNSKWKNHFSSPDPGFDSDLCQNHTMAYLHHLFKASEILGIQLATAHNLSFYSWLMTQIREHIEQDTYMQWYPQFATQTSSRNLA